ncbi:MAG: 2-C-methyl-D-erythritol 2,4-cyclodiphosphate synthase [Candidatus Zixiibacteriota bacterium]
MPEFRVGYGFAAHRLVEGTKLVIGGLEIDAPLSLEGDYDADVLVHSIVDALLGAANLGDIRENFPSTDSKYVGIASLRLLELVKIKLSNGGYEIENIDATVIAELPQLRDLREYMASAIATELGIDEYQVSIKFTSTDGLGCTAGGKGAAAAAVVCLHEISPEDEEEENGVGSEEEFEDE